MQDLSYDYDDFCNLAARKDNLRNLEETFTYDDLNRLVGVRLNGGNHDGIKYDAYGRMASKQAYGQTVFEGAQYETYDQAGRLKPHAMSGATMALRPFPTDNQSITYTMFDKVKTISQSGNGPQMSLSYTYGHDRQRIHMEEKIGDYTLREKRYGDHCEIMIENRYTVSRTFLSGPLGVFAVVEHHGDGDEFHYVYKDHLGSWTTITDGAGNVEREQSFDAWGNPRDAETWSGGYNAPLMFDRGFTGHEHLTSFGLINMNGRMYDPVMSTFLSPDNYIQAPDFSQSFNRYSYCLNNPLKYTDPSGWVMVGGMKPMPWSTPLQRPVHGPSTLTNAYNLVNLAFYGNLYGPDFAGGAGGASGSGGGAVSIADLQGTYGYYAAYQANSVHNYTFPSAQLQLIRNWHNNPSHSTNSDVREAGITNVSVGTLHGQLDGKDGYRNSYYHWTDNSGKARFAAVCFEYVGGNSNGISVLSLQPLEKYGEEARQLNKANLLAQSLGIPFGTIQNGMECAAMAYNNVSVLSGNLSKAQYVNALTREGVGMLKAVRGLGYTCGGVAVVISGYQTIDYYVQGGEGSAVFFKGLTDVGMVAVGLFGGPVGLGLSISYFVLDVSTDGFGVSYEVKP